MREWAQFETRDGEGGGQIVALSGPMTVSSIGKIDGQLRDFQQPVAAVDLSKVSDIDTVGAWVAWRIADACGAQITGASDKAERLIDAVGRGRSEADIRPPRADLIERVPEAVGNLVSGWGQGTLNIVSFLGALIAAGGALIRHPRRFRCAGAA